MRMSMLAMVLMSLFLPVFAIAQSIVSTSAEAALAKLDMSQKEMVAQADIEGLTALAAPELRINAPTGRVLTRDQFLAMMRDGKIGAENFERNVESVKIAGEIGVVMGNEIFTPTAQSELGRAYGAIPLKRRFTNIYRLNSGRWFCFARHANVVMENGVR